jgi:hypothetical protein
MRHGVSNLLLQLNGTVLWQGGTFVFLFHMLDTEVVIFSNLAQYAVNWKNQFHMKLV